MILIGLSSQGAQVAHNSLNALGDDVKSHIAAVVSSMDGRNLIVTN